MTVTWERSQDGYIAWHGTLKLGVLSTKHNKGLQREGRFIFEPLPRSDWGFHFTSPAMRIDVLAEIVRSMPTEP